MVSGSPAQWRHSPVVWALVRILEEESVSCQAPLSPNNKTKELRKRKHTRRHVLINNLSSGRNLLTSECTINLVKSQDGNHKMCPRTIRWTDVMSFYVAGKSRSFPPTCEQEAARRRRCVALGRNRRSADASIAKTTSPPPLLVFPFISKSL